MAPVKIGFYKMHVSRIFVAITAADFVPDYPKLNINCTFDTSINK
jgi:hypothetical protein